MTGQFIFEMALALFDEPEKGKFEKSSYVTIVQQIFNQGYREVCRRAQCSRNESDIITEANRRIYDFPTDCTSVLSVRLEGTPLIMIRESDIVTLIKGMPQAYYLSINTIGLEPLPDRQYRLDVAYYTKPGYNIALEDVPELVPEEWQHVIAYYMVKEFFKIDKGDQSEGFAKWNSIYEDELFKMKNYYNEGINANYYLGVT